MFNADLVKIIFELLPGFFAAWIFFGLTTHPRRDVFERVVHALIFTGIIRVVVNCLGWFLLLLGKAFSLGQWTDRVQLGWSMLFAVILGVVASALANRDTIHHWLREGEYTKRFKITSKNSFPSEWFSAFQRDKRYVVLHFKDDRRLHGWAEEWPNEPTGHFLITCPSWMLPDGTRCPLPQVHRMIVPGSAIEWVEQLTHYDELTMTPEEIAQAQVALVATNVEATSNPSPSVENSKDAREHQSAIGSDSSGPAAG